MIERGICWGSEDLSKSLTESSVGGLQLDFPVDCQWICQYLCLTSIRSLFLQHVVGYIRNFFCLTLSISRYPLSNRRYIAIIADIFRDVIHIFE